MRGMDLYPAPPFRVTMANIRATAHKRRKRGLAPLVVDIDAEYLKQVWRDQKGMCAITGIPMVRATEAKWDSASVDRINPALGYIPGNVRLLIYCVNAFRGVMTDEQMIAVARKIVSFAELDDKLRKFHAVPASPHL